jgi:hypothetical protein
MSKGHVQNGAVLPEPEAEVVQEKAEAPVAITPVQPK